MAKDANKPKGRMSSYSIFVKTCREEHKKKHPNDNVVFADFSKKCSERWKVMSDKEKQRFHNLAEKDKARFNKEMSTYVPPKGTKKGKKKKDPNAPKRALSAFFWFCADERPKAREVRPDASVGDIAKELGEKWKNCPADLKKKYEALALKDKQRYERENSAYKAKEGNPKGSKKVAEESSEEEEESDEE